MTEISNNNNNNNNNNSNSNSSTNNTSTTTRVCIKNLPPSYDEKKLQSFLIKESKVSLRITDAKLLRRTDGTSRKMAFLGFSSAQQASHVVSHFNLTYCQSSRLTVELAIAKQATELPRPWSKHSKGSTNYDKIHGTSSSKKNKEKETKQDNSKTTTAAAPPVVDKRKEEFLAAMGVGKDKTKFWANDDTIAPVQQQQQQQQQNDHKDNNHNNTNEEEDNESDDDDESSVASDDSGGQGADIMQSTTIKQPTAGSVVTDLDFLKSKATAKDELESDDEQDDDEKEEKMNDNDVVGETKKDDSDSDDSSTSSDDDSSDDDDDKPTTTTTTTTSQSSSQPAAEQHVQQPTTTTARNANNETTTTTPDVDDDPMEEEQDEMAHNRLFVRNLPFSTTEEELKELFISFGEIDECHIPVDDQKRNKGFAFVAFDKIDAAARAKDALDGTDFQGRLLHLLAARKNNAPDELSPDDPNLTYKQKQDLIRKQQESTQGWSASFVRGDAVVDNLAARLGLRKGDILNVKDGKSGDAAVRLALGETHIIEENRQYFATHGIDMEALVSSASSKDALKRSTRAILVKNLPFETEKDELTKLFGDAPDRILLPPSRTIALVEYGHSVDAKRAFKKLAYKRFKHVPLYLEWAPLAAGLETADVKEGELKETKEQEATKQEKTEQIEADDQADSSVSFSIYVKNLNFVTTEEQLRALFEKHVTVRAVKIPLKAAPVKRVRSQGDEEPAKMLSMGFGFVECDSDESVRKALRALQGSVLDEHALELKRSSKSLKGGDSAVIKPPKGKNPTKIMCRNVPFQATRKEILQLFGSFGQLKKARLPKKFDGQHRGFAFIEFLTSQEAQAAMTALSRTHLYGRHLVLEWASDNEEMDLLREKAKRDIEPVKAKEMPQNKKIKFNFD